MSASTATRAVVAFALVALLVLVGCGTKFLNTGKAESEIKSGITEQTGDEVKSVECPEDVEVKKGDTFECTATAADGSSASVKVTQTDDEGNVSWEVVSPESETPGGP